MSEINVVPYIDVMLVLLVIFMATAPLLTQGVLVDLPKAPSEPITDTADDPLVVSIREDGAIFVNLGIRNADDEGTRVTVYSLEDQAAKILRARPDVPVYVKADHRLDYGMVVRVMSVLQQAGAESVGLITDPVDLSGMPDRLPAADARAHIPRCDVSAGRLDRLSNVPAASALPRGQAGWRLDAPAIPIDEACSLEG